MMSGKRIGKKSTSLLLAMLLFMIGLTSGVSEGATFTKFWRDMSDMRGKKQMAVLNTAYQRACLFMTTMMYKPLWVTMLQLPQIGRFGTEIGQVFLSQTLGNNVPNPPLIFNSEVKIADDKTRKVHITYQPSNTSKDNAMFVYALYRYNPVNQERTLVDREPLYGIYRDSRTLVDRTPPAGVWFYTMTASQIYVPLESLDGAAFENAKPWWELPEQGIWDPANLWWRKSVLTSDYSAPVSVLVGDTVTDVRVADLAVDPKTGDAYYAATDGQNIYRISNVAGRMGGASRFTVSGFKTPGHHGLAIDAAGNLFTDNSASDSQFGGRIFKFNQPDGTRELAGTINYYSMDLMYARPTMSGAMVMDKDGQLLVMDEMERTLKKVAVNATYDPLRRVGQQFANLSAGPPAVSLDLEVAPDKTVYALYHKLNEVQATGVKAETSYYFDVPWTSDDAAAQITSVEKSGGLITRYGLNQVKIVATAIGDDGQPKSGVPVHFYTDFGSFSVADATTDDKGKAETRLRIRIPNDYSDPVPRVSVRADISGYGSHYLEIPVEDNYKTVIDTYMTTYEVGNVIKTGSYYADPFALGVFPGAYNNINYAYMSLTGRGKTAVSDNMMCGDHQKRVLALLDNINWDPDKRYQLNGLEYGPAAVWGGAHVAVSLWLQDKYFMTGWILDSWINQEAEVWKYSIWSSRFFFIGHADIVSWSNLYPFTGGKYYPGPDIKRPKKTDPKTKYAGVVKCPVNVSITGNGGFMGVTGGEMQYIQDGLMMPYGEGDRDWYFELPDGAFEMQITGTADGTFSIDMAHSSGNMVSHKDLPISAGQTVTLSLNAANPDAQVVYDNGHIGPVPTLTQIGSISVIQPVEGTAGSTMNIEITGEGTHFVQGGSVAVVSSGITANSLVVHSPTSATLNISIDPSAPIGSASVAIRTGGEYAQSVVPFEILAQ
jgi:hypothetical protein